MLSEKQRQMVNENHDLIYGFANAFNVDLEEYYGILAIELCETAQDFNPEMGSLSTIFYTRARNRMMNEYNSENAYKRSGKLTVSLDEIEDIVGDLDCQSPMEFDLEWLEEDVREMVEMRIKGFTQCEIAEFIGKSQPHVSKVLARFKDQIMEMVI